MKENKSSKEYMHPKHLHIADFIYPLPEEKIAKFPVAERDTSKLLHYKKGAIADTVFNQLPQLLPSPSLLVFNDTKVVQSRLVFKKETGGEIEIFILETCKEYGEMHQAMQTTQSIQCHCLVGGAKKWKSGKLTMHSTLNQQPVWLTAQLIEKGLADFKVELEWQPELNFAIILEIFGHTPIPPYLNRSSNEADKKRYQTIYAAANGSVAAPTAGLHFTPRVMDALALKKIKPTYVTLHVGAGTFKPVKSRTIAGHPMHQEQLAVNINLIEQLLAHASITVVGTTSMRALESMYWMGVKIYENKSIALEDLPIKQWEVYDGLMHLHISKQAALQALLMWMQSQGHSRFFVPTQIMIAPGYTPKICTGLVTNFHQPQSTLLLLIAALVGDDWRRMYAHALQNNFRFLSYGDGCFIQW